MSQSPPPVFDAKTFLSTLTSRPGVYRMMDATGDVLYVGKARNLKRRVSSYFRASGLTAKTMAMIAKVARIDVTVTASETEALLLEQSLIKSARPAYNIQLRDDKSYPYILLTDYDRYPRLAFYRGSRRRRGTLFGPYPSAHATRDTLNLLQKVFRVRQCEDSYFRNRSRPCLQYQIDRCTAPCVEMISPEAYAEDVRHAQWFLQGKSDELIRELSASMAEAATRLDYERAARLRDQISDLRRIHSEQHVENVGSASGNVDVLAAVASPPYYCVHGLYIRGGRVIGSRNHFPGFRLPTRAADVISAFVGQHYLQARSDTGHDLPDELLVDPMPDDAKGLSEVLSLQAEHPVRVRSQVRGHRARWLHLAQTNARIALDSLIAQRQTQGQRMVLLQEALHLHQPPRRIECFDVSHTGGEGTVASCVVFDTEGPVKADYRRFNIRDVAAGDDYAAMAQVIERRFAKISETPDKVPDIVLIDGGRGQVKQAMQALEPYGLPGTTILGIAKGISRKAGQETLLLAHGEDIHELVLPGESAALLLLQQVRDEAHRFAITGHRQRRQKARSRSPLEDLPGLGPKRRKALLTHFGGMQGLQRASEADLARVPGISFNLAAVIYAHLHADH